MQNYFSIEMLIVILGVLGIGTQLLVSRKTSLIAKATAPKPRTDAENLVEAKLGLVATGAELAFSRDRVQALAQKCRELEAMNERLVNTIESLVKEDTLSIRGSEVVVKGKVVGKVKRFTNDQKPGQGNETSISIEYTNVA